jgi:hypothetical protein
MTDHSKNQFSASASALGYLFQVRYALLESLKRLRNLDDFLVSIETLDDVVFESEGQPVDILQTKHHCKRTANLTDASPDLWKTIRIWAEGFANGSINDGSNLYLITTSRAANGSAAYYLRPGETRDVKAALERLNSTAESSVSKTNNAAYTAYRALDLSRRMSLVGSIVLFDQHPSILDIDEQFREIIFYAAPKKHIIPFLQRLEGWWFRRSIIHLSSEPSLPIMSEELQAETDRLREQFKDDNLPIDDDIMQAVVDASGYENEVFVRQLRLIEIGNKRIFHAIRNFFRAFEHRSRWVRDDLLLVGDLERYEDRLIEEWEVLFHRMKDELGKDAAETSMKKAAKTIYEWVENGVHPTIRPGVTEPAISRGSYQMLADRLEVGWHPEFKERLRQVLELAEVEA